MDGWMVGWMVGWIIGWMDGLMDGWVGGWLDVPQVFSLMKCHKETAAVQTKIHGSAGDPKKYNNSTHNSAYLDPQ